MIDSYLIHSHNLIAKMEKSLEMLKNFNLLLSISLMEIKEIAMVIDDEQLLEWINNQLNGYQNIMLLSDFRKEVTKDQELTTFVESVTILERKLQQQYDIPKDAGYSNVYGALKIQIVEEKSAIQETLDWIRQKAHTWLTKKVIEIKAGYLPENIFTEIKQYVDSKVQSGFPNVNDRLSAIFDYLSSTSKAKWADAVLECREILRELADGLSPARDGITSQNEHKLGSAEYKNRLIEFVKGRVKSDSFVNIFGTTLQNFVDRLEAIYEASCKGKFLCNKIEDAKRHVLYTYMLMADILHIDEQHQEEGE